MSQKQIELQSSDGESVKVEKDQSRTISEDNSNKNVIPIENFTNHSLSSLLFHQFASAEENLPSTTSKELTMSKKKNELQSSNGVSFKVEEAIAHQPSQTIEDDSTKNVITKKKLPSLKDRKTISTKKKTVLQSSNGESVKVEEAIANQSKKTELQNSNGESVKVEEAIANQSKKIEDNCTKNVITLENVTKKDLPFTSSNEQTTSKKMIVLQSFDGGSFVVEEAIARQSKTISLMIDEDCTKNEITLENVTSKILAIVIEYCKKHHVDANSSSSSSEELKKWDAKFTELDQNTIFQLILASNYLNIKGLHDLTCQTVANMIKGKTADQIRAHFKIKNDFTPEEERQIYHENRWVFD